MIFFPGEFFRVGTKYHKKATVLVGKKVKMYPKSCGPPKKGTPGVKEYCYQTLGRPAPW